MYRTVIVRDKYDVVCKTLLEEYNKINDDGSAFVLYTTEYDKKGNVKRDFMDVIEYGLSLGFCYVTTIVYPLQISQSVTFDDNAGYIVWLCKNRKNMHFNKDSIREKHIWKDVEWGKRKKNYNPKGKDPGNVWIPTEDDGDGNITKHIFLSENDIKNRLIAMTESEKNCKIHINDIIGTSILTNGINPKPICEQALKYKVIFNSSEDMKHINDESVKLMVTSPPYWDLKDYFKKGQIGQEPYKQYLSRLEKVWKQTYKKLSGSGSMWININIRVKDGNPILIPKDIIKDCKDIGFFYRGIIIWHKSSGIPTKNNLVDRHEYLLIFSKSQEFSVNKEVSQLFKDYRDNDMSGQAFWNINRKAGSVGKKYIHPAIYPNQLVERIILSCTDSGDLVVDTFLGSGTSLIAASTTNRSFIGYEYNEGFRDLMQMRFNNEIKQCNFDVEFTN